MRPFNGREKDAKSSCIIRVCESSCLPAPPRRVSHHSSYPVQMKGPVTTLINPEDQQEKEFAFDYSYWSHDGFETDDTGYNEAVPGTSKFGAAAWPPKWPRGVE